MPPELALTADDYTAMRLAVEGVKPELNLTGVVEAAYLAGLRAGYRRGIEDAAKECDNNARLYPEFGK